MAQMAPRLMTFVSERPAAVVWSAAAALFSAGLWWQWRSFEVRQEAFLVFYSRAAEGFAGELDLLAPSSDFLVIWAVLTGFMIAAAVIQWRLPAR